jgi:hypothetical protein
MKILSVDELSLSRSLIEMIEAEHGSLYEILAAITEQRCKLGVILSITEKLYTAAGVTVSDAELLRLPCTEIVMQALVKLLEVMEGVFPPPEFMLQMMKAHPDHEGIT